LAGESALSELKNCKRCNKVFSYLAGLPICPACQKEDEKIFEEASMYIRDHPGVPLTVVSKELKISYEKLMKYVREGRLQVLSSKGEYIKFCEKCGVVISGNRFCASCEGHIAGVLDTSKKKLQGSIEAAKKRSDYRFL
jgi:Zn finger protein HypA/HybF involved in hydrogenase expression